MSMPCLRGTVQGDSSSLHERRWKCIRSLGKGTGEGCFSLTLLFLSAKIQDFKSKEDRTFCLPAQASYWCF